MVLYSQPVYELNLALQILLALALAAAIHLARKKRFRKHCALVRVLMIVQILAVLAVMLPAMSVYGEAQPLGPLFRAEVYGHHVLGLAAMALWAYVNLAYLHLFSPRLPLKMAMRLTAGSWMLSLLLGLHIYYWLYL